MDLTGRVAVITGATGGLGRVAARTFAEHGAALALLSSDQARLDTLSRELNLPNERCLTHAADLRDPTAARAAAEAVSAAFGQAHILLHLVGGWVGGKEIAATDPRDLQAMVDQHVWTTWHLLQAFIPRLTAAGWGRVIVVSSPVATRPAAKSGAYAVAKAAEEALLLTLAQETRDRGVTANVIQVRKIDVEHERDKQPSSPRPSSTTPEEIAAAMLYLCSDGGAPVNGVRLSLAD